jgi:MFS family permease
VFARDVLQAGPTGQGLLLTSMGIGALTSAILIASFGNRLPKGMLMLAGATCYGLTLVAFSLSSWFLISALFIMIAGLCNVACNALIQTIVQTHTPPELRGRVMSVFQQNQVVLTVGSMAAGAIASTSGAQWAVGSMGALCAIGAIAIFIAIPRARTIK